jgi:tetratricopeptide (TPR) repeat protein
MNPLPPGGQRKGVTMTTRFQRTGRPGLIAACLLAISIAPGPATANAPAQAGAPKVEAPERPDYYDIGRAPRHVRRVLLRAAAAVNHDRRDEAIAMIEGHLRDHPDQDHDLLHLHLAQNLVDAGRTAEARDHYRRAAALEPRLDRAWFGLADTAYDLEDYAVAADAFAHGYEASFERSPQVLFFAASAWLLADEPEPALAIFERLTGAELNANLPYGVEPMVPDIKWVRGQLAAANQVQKPELAGPAVQKLMDVRPADPEVWYLKYQYEAALRDFPAATVALRVVGFLRPLSAVEEKQLGDLLMVNGVSQLASEHYKRALTTESTTAEVERLASALVTAHETAQALRVLQDALANSEDTHLWSLIGDVHYLRREYAEALAAFDRVAQGGDDSGRAWLMQGYCALELGQKNEALDLLARASSFPDQADLAQRLIQRALKMLDG